MNWRSTIIACGILLMADPAFALRCGNKLVNKGSPQVKVLKYCGEPEAVQVRSMIRGGFPRHQLRRRVGNTEIERELLFTDRAYVEVVVEEWTYNFGPRRLMRIIRFENGIVTSIRQVGYGYN
ncbi:MAG: DUF2845 domain-containing protein [Gammaproteobacteria bacterium]